MSSRFDNVAESFDSSLQPLPEEYYNLIQNRFNLSENSKVIDLGCGAGLLTFSLSQFSNYIEGIDISHRMIEIALSRDKEKKIKWENIEVENFNFGYGRYSLIISYESFHLFPNIDEIVKKCALGLRPNGFLCIGWCNYQWEGPLKNIILDTFRSFGIEWGEWGYQRCNDFSLAVEQNEKYLSPVVEETIKVQNKSHIKDISLYLASIDKSIELESYERINLMKKLELNFRSFLSSDWICGNTSYTLSYSRRLNY
ncbi:class I SAM-dependent methyltransferase [Candidatus Pacearchaeota archaeon]|nr:class I SAM-dependent methyltransferase [Candidatus Pacearchaeota archaeon]